MAMTDKSKAVLNYLKEHDGEELTSADVAEALGVEKRSVDGTFTSLQKKGYGVRIPAEIELPDGTHRQVKFLKLTDDGFNVDPDADEAPAQE